MSAEPETRNEPETQHEPADIDLPLVIAASLLKLRRTAEACNAATFEFKVTDKAFSGKDLRGTFDVKGGRLRMRFRLPVKEAKK